MIIPGSTLRLLRPLVQKAADLGIPMYAVGGCVRDWLRGSESKDLDLAFEGDPGPVARLCGEVLRAQPESFGQFGTLRVVGSKFRVDFAMSRRERYPEPACLPLVEPAPIKEDLFRRDFTVNAMALPLSPDSLGESADLIDPFGGLKDMRLKILRTLHPASFRDDPTRVFRAARFLCRFSMTAAPGFLDQAQEALEAGYPRSLSRHRLAHELVRVLEERSPFCALKTLRDWGYLALIHPALKWPPRFLPGAPARLGAMALAMGKEGESFLGSLPLEREVAARIREILALARGRAAPRQKPSAQARRVVAEAYPKLPPGALRALWINGADIEALGIAPGKRYRAILDRAARAQWKGKIRSRDQALKWLKKHFPSRR